MKAISPLLLLFLVSIVTNVLAQESGIDLPVDICKRQNVQINHNLGVGTYSWDFCSGELNRVPQGSGHGTIPGAVGRPGVDLVLDGDTWYGFVTGTWTNSLYRLTYGDGVDKPFTNIEDLGTLGSVLNNPGQVRIINQDGRWYGMIHNAGAGELLKLTFESSLTSEITPTLLLSGIGTINSGLAVAKDTNGWVSVIPSANNTITIMHLGMDINPPAETDILVTDPVPDANNIGDVDLIKTSQGWFGIVNNFGNGNFYRLAFGADLFSIPSVSFIATLPVNNNGRLRLAQDGEEYFAFSTSLDGPFHKFSFGSTLLNSPEVVRETTLEEILGTNSYGLAVVKNLSEYIIQTVSLADGKLSRISYGQPCSSNRQISDEQFPFISYAESGDYRITLEFSSGSDEIVTVTEDVMISQKEAPEISFTNENVCANHDVLLKATSTEVITGYSWQLGEGITKSGEVVVHQFSAGVYYPKLIASASNGCINTTSHGLQIYDEPVADFKLPAAPLCTGDDKLFVNATPDVYNGLLTYKWYVNNELVSEAKELQYTFEDIGDYNVSLEAALPGCYDIHAESIHNIVEGPLVDFSLADSCENVGVKFINSSSGNIKSVKWNFGDGKVSTEWDPTSVYADADEYRVELSADGMNGCSTTLVKNIQIHPAPSVDFEIVSPVVLCEGAVVQFADKTIWVDEIGNTREWNFGDNSIDEISTDSTVLHTYAPGTFVVDLSVQTGYGCRAFVQKEITIFPAPEPAITFPSACVGTPVTLEGIATNIQAWNWTIGDKTYDGKNIEHVFRNSGIIPINLLVTSIDGCLGSVQKHIVIPDELEPDFSVLNNCVNAKAEFLDVSIGEDPVIQWTWTINDNIVTTNPAVVSIDKAGDYPVTMELVTEAGCIYAISKTIPVAAAPVATFMSSAKVGSPAMPISFTNNSQHSQFYTWTFDDETSSEDFEPTHSFQSTGIFNITLTASNEFGCADTYSQTINISSPLPDVSILSVSVVENMDRTVDIVINIQNNGNTILQNAPVEIDISGSVSLVETIKGPIMPQARYNHQLSYTLRDLNDIKFLCAAAELDGDQNTDDNRYCIEFTHHSLVLPGYPNPVNSELNVEWIAAVENHTTVSLINADGVTVWRYSVEAKKGFNKRIIPVDDLQTGIYMLIVQSPDHRTTQRILIAR